MKKIHLRIVTPDRTVVDKPVDMVGAVGTEGAFTVLPGHTDFLTAIRSTALRSDALWYRQDGRTKGLVVSGGFIEVKPDHVRVLADSAEYVEHFDVEKVKLSFKRNKELMAKAKAAGQSGKHKHHKHPPKHSHGHGHDQSGHDQSTHGQS